MAPPIAVYPDPILSTGFEPRFPDIESRENNRENRGIMREFRGFLAARAPSLIVDPLHSRPALSVVIVSGPYVSQQAKPDLAKQSLLFHDKNYCLGRYTYTIIYYIHSRAAGTFWMCRGGV